jgi:Fe-Mn family superoxide dismutase
MKTFGVFITEKKQLVQRPLPVADNALAPVMSKATIDYHFHTLAKGYVDHYNKGQGDPRFNEAGAYLHNVFFIQFQQPKNNNAPDGEIAAWIDEHFDSFDLMKKSIEDVAMKIQGSGWVYVSSNGDVKTIPNHQKRSDIVLLIDWWEHAWALDYQADKKQYLDNIWKIINWSVIETRI